MNRPNDQTLPQYENQGEASLPGYEHTTNNEDAAPIYMEQEVKDINDFILPNNLEIYRPDFPHMHISAPMNKRGTRLRQISFVTVKLGKQTAGKNPAPAVSLHAGPDQNTRILADVKFIKQSSDITVYHTPTLGLASEASHYKLSFGGAEHSFQFADQGSGMARYNWVHSGTEEVKALAATNLPGERFANVAQRGLKLVRKRNNVEKIVAVFVMGWRAPVANPRRIAGKLRFLDASNDVEDRNKYRLIVLMSVLSMMEEGRVNQALAGGAYAGCTIS